MTQHRFLFTILSIGVLSPLACDGGGSKLPTEVPFEGVVEGTVSAEGAPLSEVEVRLSGSVLKTAHTSTSGAYAFPGLPAGSYVVRIQGFPDHVEFASPSQSASVAEGHGRARVDFLGTLKRDACIQGAVTLDGAGAGGLQVSLSGPEDASHTTDENGAFSAGGLRRGTYTVTLSGFDPQLHSFPTTSVSVEAEDEHPVEVHFAGSLIPQPPDAPENLGSEASGWSAVGLTWNDLSHDETHFRLHRREGADGTWSQIAQPEANATTFQDTGVNPLTTYTYQIQACNDAGCSSFSNETTATTTDAPPVPPSALTAVPQGPFAVDLSWSDNSANESEFQIERRAPALDEWASLGQVAADVVAFTDGGLSPNSTYLYRIRACNAVGCSPYSEEASATTEEVAPQAPSGLSATVTGSTSIELVWSDESGNESRFELERKGEGEAQWNSVETLDSDVTSYRDEGLAPNRQYTYRIRACNEVGCSPWSNEAGASTDEVPPDSPINLDAEAAGSTSIQLSWEDRSSNETGFELQRKQGSGEDWSHVTEMEANATATQDQDLSPSTLYRYRIRACNEAGCSSFSNEASARTDGVPPVAPSGLSASAGDPTTVDLSWTDEGQNETGFRVERREEGSGTYTDAGTVGSNTTEFTDTDLTPNTTYRYRVLAFNEWGSSSPSGEAHVTTPEVDGPNLLIADLYITQSTQTLDGTVPLVADKDGVLRVFPVASEANSLQPAIRVEFYLGGSLVNVETLSAPGTGVPTSVSEGVFSASWNVDVPASLIQPGLAILAEVDPADDIAEANEGDNHFPVGGSPLSLDVRNTPTFNVTFVPVRQSVNNLVGNVTSGNAPQFLDVTLNMLPVAQANLQLHAEYVTDADPLESDNGNGAWGTILGEINALRVAEGSSRNYYGVVKTGYSSGVAGMGYLGWPAAIGWDRLPGGSGIAAHEWGHNWNLHHASGCGAANPDPSYPYPEGKIGVWGMDVTGPSLKSPATFYDFMSYCGPDWVSDYHYEKILTYREAHGGMGAPGQRGTGNVPEPTLLVWGRIQDNRITLEPAFKVNTRAHLPGGDGEYVLEAVSFDGTILFADSFQPLPLADALGNSSHFAFAIPTQLLPPEELGTLRVRGPGAEPGIRESSAGPLAVATPQPELTPLGDNRLEVAWDPASFPMVLIRDPGSGEVLSFARGGAVRLPSIPGEVELIFSDGIRSPEPVRRSIR